MSKQDNLNKLQIPFINLASIPSPDDVAPYLNNFNPISIQTNPWPQYQSLVAVNYTIGHNGNAIFLKYNVRERYLLANATTNGKVNEDSCVEFFISLDDNGNYYNLEFNCLGWCKIGYGNNRKNRKTLNSDLVELISSTTKIDSSVTNSKKSFSWEITLVIPISVFYYSKINSFTGIKARGNFYKCGDGLPEPHYLAWSPIESEEPDFHRPEYFGQLKFT